MKKIITIQHTQSIHHTNGMIGSWTDWDLSEKGIEQAENIGKRLGAELANQNYIMYTSDLLRARHTAEIIAKHLGIKPIVTEALRERNLGAAVGKSVQWARENSKSPLETIDDRPFDGAESRRDTWNRLLPFYHGIMEGGNENIIIVSHGDTLSIFNALWLGLVPEMLNQCDLLGFAGGVSFLQEREDGKHMIRRLSDMSYIKE